MRNASPDYVTDITLSGDVYIAERAPSLAWVDVDTDDGITKYQHRGAVLRGGAAPHCGPVMPWPAWVELARALVERHGGASSVASAHSADRIEGGWRMAIVREADGRWRGVSPRNGTYASCEGTLAEAVSLARGILAREAGGVG